MVWIGFGPLQSCSIVAVVVVVVVVVAAAAAAAAAVVVEVMEVGAAAAAAAAAAVEEIVVKTMQSQARRPWAPSSLPVSTCAITNARLLAPKGETNPYHGWPDN